MGGEGVDRFAVKVNGDKVTITKGHYYVDGILCESLKVGEYPILGKARTEAQLIYLEVWERHLTPYEIDGTFTLEPALGNLDTTTRVTVVWQPKALLLTLTEAEVTALKYKTTATEEYEWFKKRLKGILIDPKARGMMAASAVSAKGVTMPGESCTAGGDPAYLGEDNQLFRVEIHEGGTAGSDKLATFEWSRDNASAYFPVPKSAVLDPGPGTFSLPVQSPVTMRVRNVSI